MITIKREENGTHSVGGERWAPYGLKEYKKKVTTLAVQMLQPFSVETLEGTMEGKAGDWLMVGANGEMYPCDDKIFHKTYELAEGG